MKIKRGIGILLSGAGMFPSWTFSVAVCFGLDSNNQSSQFKRDCRCKLPHAIN
ncbi:MAG: hypothetical protein ACYC6W_02070 [Nitrosotalea sp.]